MTEKPIVSITSLDQFAAENVNVNLDLGDHIESVPMRMLSYADVQKINLSVTNPKPPTQGANANGPIFDYRDPTFLAQVQAADNRRMLLCLIASLRLDIPGETEDDKIDYLSQMSSGRLGLLIKAMTQLANEGEVSITSAATFHDDGAGATGAGV